MAKYNIDISRTAEKRLKKINKRDRDKIVQALLGLCDDPYRRGSRKLSGYDDVFRIRVGKYRVIYSISDKKLTVIILKIGHRKDVYQEV